jgi:hypothetical protein
MIDWMTPEDSMEDYIQYFYEKLTFEKKGDEILLPFDPNFEQKLFDKEADNMYKEDIYEAQLFAKYLSIMIKKLKLKEELFKSFKETHIQQSKFIFEIISKITKVCFDSHSFSLEILLERWSQL